MRKIIAVFFLLMLEWLSAQVSGGANFVWFDQVTAPLKLSESQLMQVTARLHQALKAQTPLPQLMTGIPDDPSPRVVFLTIGDDQWPARTYFGTGFSFCDALGKAVSILRSSEKARIEGVVKQATSIIDDARKERRKIPRDWVDRRNAPAEWTWLKVQPVQAAKRYPSFSFARSNFSFSALAGFAFGPSMGFAFTPDQITGRYLLTPNNFMSKKQIGNIIAESYNFDALNTWLRLSNIEQEQGICLFEVDTYYTDGTSASRMFRCHTLPAVPDAAECADGALRCAKVLADKVATLSGEYKQPFPDWYQPRQDIESRDDICELAIALRRAADYARDSYLSTAADHVRIALNNNIIVFGDKKQYHAIVDLEQLPENAVRQARSFAILRDNALAFLALAPEPDTGRPTDASVVRGKGLLAFIASMGRGDGTFHSAQVRPSGAMLDVSKDDFEGRCIDHALAAIALWRGGSQFGMPEWRALARQAVARLVTDLSSQDMNALVVDPWVVEALTLHGDGTPEQNRLLAAIGASILKAKTQSPPAADMAGAPRLYPSFTQAARMSWALALLAEHYRRRQPKYAEALMAEAAVVVAFQRQGQMDVATSSALVRPRSYVDYCRDYPDDFHFTLYGNVSQVMSLLEVSKCLKGQFKGVFPDLETAHDQLKLARRFADLHPAYLTAGVISNGKGVSEEARSSIGKLENSGKSNMSPTETERYFKRGTKGRRR